MDDHTIVTVERLRDELVNLKAAMRHRYRVETRQVAADDLKAKAAKIAETWMVQIAVDDKIRQFVASEYLADLNVQFQRLLTYSERASQRKQYDSAIQGILKQFNIDFVIPLKQSRGRALGEAVRIPASHETLSQLSESHMPEFQSTAFVGHSFAAADQSVAECVVKTLRALGMSVSTGNKPKSQRISDKVKNGIEQAYIFVGIFTRREKISRKREWTTTPWVIDEKAYAVGKNKKLLLLKEDGVGSIGGIQGDYEFLEFNRDAMELLVIKIIELFTFSVQGFKP